MEGDVPARTAVGDAPAASTAISDNAAMMNLIKCAVGAGSLSLPFAFKQGGVLFAFLLTISIGALSSYTVILLKRCEEAVAAKTPYAGLASVEPDAPAASPVPLLAADGGGGDDARVDSSGAPRAPRRLSYPEVAAGAFPGAVWPAATGGEANLMAGVVKVGIVLTSLGVCAAYVAFLSDTLPQVIGHGFTQARARARRRRRRRRRRRHHRARRSSNTHGTLGAPRS